MRELNTIILELIILDYIYLMGDWISYVIGLVWTFNLFRVQIGIGILDYYQLRVLWT